MVTATATATAMAPRPTAHLHVKTGMFDHCYPLLPTATASRQPGRRNGSPVRPPTRKPLSKQVQGRGSAEVGGRGSAMDVLQGAAGLGWLGCLAVVAWFAWPGTARAIVLVLTCMRFEISFSNGKGVARKTRETTRPKTNKQDEKRAKRKKVGRGTNRESIGAPSASQARCQLPPLESLALSACAQLPIIHHGRGRVPCAPQSSVEARQLSQKIGTYLYEPGLSL